MSEYICEHADHWQLSAANAQHSTRYRCARVYSLRVKPRRRVTQRNALRTSHINKQQQQQAHLVGTVHLIAVLDISSDVFTSMSVQSICTSAAAKLCVS
jgi:hypothetical protein